MRAGLRTPFGSAANVPMAFPDWSTSVKLSARISFVTGAGVVWAGVWGWGRPEMISLLENCFGVSEIRDDDSAAAILIHGLVDHHERIRVVR
jgi:hypothetical protein